MKKSLFISTVLLILSGCSDFSDSEIGTLGKKCFGNGTCEEGLECYSNLCTVPPDHNGEMVSIPAGKFHMGCNEAVSDYCDENEKPYHDITLSAYKIDKYEVTAGEYQKCVDTGNCNNNNASVPHYNSASKDPTCNLGAEGKENHPMQCVSWYGAKAYCEWAEKRLPTEAEWEKAARGIDGRKYPWGNEPEVSCDFVVMDDSNSGGAGCGAGGTMLVGSKEAGKSTYGTYDMLGNVWEWVNDWYSETYYETTPSSDPQGPETGEAKVLRGGSWDNSSYLCPSFRYYYYPVSWGNNTGFRCAK